MEHYQPAALHQMSTEGVASPPSGRQAPIQIHRPWTRFHRSPTAGSPQAAPAIQRTLAAGTPLPTPLRATMERLLNTSLHSVRLHTDGVARQVTSAMHADAVASGNHLFFAPGRFAPDTPRGLALLAHELTHVRQAQQGRVGSTPLAGGGGSQLVTSIGSPGLVGGIRSMSGLTAAPIGDGQTGPSHLMRPVARLQAQQGLSTQATAEREREALTMEQAVLAGRNGTLGPAPGMPTVALPSFAAATGRVESAVTSPELHLALTVAPVHASPAAAATDRSLAASTAGEPATFHSEPLGPAAVAQSSPTQTPAPGTPNEPPDLQQLAQAVARILERNARVEAERRGVQRWR